MEQPIVVGNNETTEVPRSYFQRARRSAISDDFLLYFHEVEHDEGCDEDPLTIDHAVNSNKAEFWQQAMREEMESMSKNSVWKLVESSPDIKPIGCKWVYKTKKNSNGNCLYHT